MNKRLSLFIFVVAIGMPFAFAGQGSMTLLAVSETNQGFEGTTANLFLETKPGTGKIFVDTFPLTKLDTQMSIRFANSIACDYLEKDCSYTDFFYTVRSDSATVGGPSAGAAVAMLTIAVLSGYQLDQSIAVTGTINSGGHIGPVGGLKEKIDAAKQAGLSKVIVPKGEQLACEDCNTTDIKGYADSIGITLSEVLWINDVVYEYTGQKRMQKNLSIDRSYEETMRGIAQELCQRTRQLIRKGDSPLKEYEEARNLSIQGARALEDRAFYSAASYCFGANIRLGYAILKESYPAPEEIERQQRILERNITQKLADIGVHESRTITDLQASIIVQERLRESKERLTRSKELLLANNTDGALWELSYSNERLLSAVSWSSFLGMPGKEFAINEDLLKDSCQSKIAEAEERLQYAELYFRSSLNDTRKDFQMAYNYLENGEYRLCLYKASIAKAVADTMIAALGIEQEQLENYARQKIFIAEQNIARQQAKGVFPILAYSYYEYATSLIANDKASALIYAEYSLELANIDIYFKQPKSSDIIGLLFRYSATLKLAFMFVLGTIFGYLVVLSKNR